LADLEVAWEIGANYADQDFSIVDRTSLAVMRRSGLNGSHRSVIILLYFASDLIGGVRLRSCTKGAYLS
jgi:hypothetical protein